MPVACEPPLKDEQVNALASVTIGARPNHYVVIDWVLAGYSDHHELAVRRRF